MSICFYFEKISILIEVISFFLVSPALLGEQRVEGIVKLLEGITQKLQKISQIISKKIDKLIGRNKEFNRSKVAIWFFISIVFLLLIIVVIVPVVAISFKNIPSWIPELQIRGFIYLFSVLILIFFYNTLIFQINTSVK